MTIHVQIQMYLGGSAKDKRIRLIKRRGRDGWVGFHYRLHMTVDGYFSTAECRLKRTAAITTQKWPVAADPACSVARKGHCYNYNMVGLQSS